jgi:hypothetical protein
MQNLVKNIIANRASNYFEFYRNSNSPVGHLKEQTSTVPNRSGMYLVFSKKSNEAFCENCAHLNFEIDLVWHELLYFGKAGGHTKGGRALKQGLKGRINNVISDSSRNLKHVKRAVYWDIVMNEFNFEKLIIIYIEHINPQEVENSIYRFLDESNRKYPSMNKRRGR